MDAFWKEEFLSTNARDRIRSISRQIKFKAPAIPPDGESAHDLTFPFLYLNPGVLFGLVTVAPIPEDYTEACTSHCRTLLLDDPQISCGSVNG
jgi:hypothetical protein